MRAEEVGVKEGSDGEEGRREVAARKEGERRQNGAKGRELKRR